MQNKMVANCPILEKARMINVITYKNFTIYKYYLIIIIDL